MYLTTLHPTANYLHTSPPSEGLRRMHARCQSCLIIIHRSKLPAEVKEELSSTWKYIASFVRYLSGQWRSTSNKNGNAVLRHLHYQMLPDLLSEHVPKSSRIIREHTKQVELRRCWRSIWKA